MALMGSLMESLMAVKEPNIYLKWDTNLDTEYCSLLA